MDKPETCSILSEAMVLQENPKYISDMSVCASRWDSTEINLMLKTQAGFDCVYVSLAAEVPPYSERAEGPLHLYQNNLHEDKKKSHDIYIQWNLTFNVSIN